MYAILILHLTCCAQAVRYETSGVSALVSLNVCTLTGKCNRLQKIRLFVIQRGGEKCPMPDSIQFYSSAEVKNNFSIIHYVDVIP